MAQNKKEIAFEKEDQNLAIKSDSEWTKQININMPLWAIRSLDKEANRRGITRQSLIKTWLIDRIDSLSTKRAS